MVLAAVALWPTVARAGLEEGRQAYRNGNYGQAFQEFLPLAQAGDTTMQNQIAGMSVVAFNLPHLVGQLCKANSAGE